MTLTLHIFLIQATCVQSLNFLPFIVPEIWCGQEKKEFFTIMVNVTLRKVNQRSNTQLTLTLHIYLIQATCVQSLNFLLFIVPEIWCGQEKKKDFFTFLVNVTLRKVNQRSNRQMTLTLHIYLIQATCVQSLNFLPFIVPEIWCGQEKKGNFYILGQCDLEKGQPKVKQTNDLDVAHLPYLVNMCTNFELPTIYSS